MLELPERPGADGITFHGMEQSHQAGWRALSPLLRKFAGENCGELITKRFDDDGKEALLFAPQGYGVDVHGALAAGVLTRYLSGPRSGACWHRQKGLRRFAVIGIETQPAARGSAAPSATVSAGLAAESMETAPLEASINGCRQNFPVATIAGR